MPMQPAYRACWKGARAVGREAVQEYLAAVGAQIRWRRARRPLLRELSNHMEDQAAEYRAQGMGEDEALTKAAAEMGDPEAVGRDLDRLHRPQNRWGLALAALVLTLMGVSVQFLIYQAGGQGMMDLYARQAAAVPAALAVLATVWFSDCTLLFRRRWAAPLLLFSAIPAVLFLCRTSPTEQWSGLHYCALLLPALYAAWICRFQGRGEGWALLCGLAALALSLPILQFSSITASGLALFGMLAVLGAAVGLGWFSGKRWRGLLLAWGPAAVLAAVWLAASPRAAERAAAFLHPERDPAGAGFLFLALRRDPAPVLRDTVSSSCDFLLAFLAQQWGRWVFAAAALLLFLAGALLLGGISRLQSRSGKLLALSCLLPLLLQWAVYLLFNMGWWPSSVCSLPFLSYGVGYLAVNSVLMGLLLSVFRMDSLFRDGPPRLILPERLALPLAGGTLFIEYRRQ